MIRWKVGKERTSWTAEKETTFCLGGSAMTPFLVEEEMTCLCFLTAKAPTKFLILNLVKT